MTEYLVKGSGKGRGTTGPSMPATDVSGHLVHGRGVARPCADRPSMPATDISGHLIHGHGIWRAPCDEATVACCACFVDDFGDREIDATDPGGWGDATSGQTYSTSAPHSFSVSDGVGHFATGGGDTVNYSITLPSDCAWQDPSGFMETFDFTVATVDGTGRRIRIEATSGPSCSFDIKPDTTDGYLKIVSVGEVEVAKLDWAADTWYSVRLEYRPGTVMRMKVWPRDDPEPGTWDLELTDTDVDGALTNALRATFSSADEWAVDVDNLTICPPTCGLYDDFEREVEEGWGDSTPTSQTYETTVPEKFSVSDGLGRWYSDGIAPTLSFITMPSFCAWQGSGGFVLTYDWFVDTDPDTIFGIGLQSTAGPFFQAFCERSNVGGGAISVQSIGSDVVGKSDWDAVAYSVKVEYRPGSVMRMKVWPQGDAEPGTWDVSISGADVGGRLTDGLYWAFLGQVSFEQNAWIDNVTFDCAPAVEG